MPRPIWKGTLSFGLRLRHARLALPPRLTVATTMANEEPDRFVDTMSKAKRRGRVFVDYLRNQRGATSICTFSTRARHGAPISIPLSWKDLATFTPGDYTIENIPSTRADPWKAFWKPKQALKA